jgi:15-cis-phytoene synthase
MSPSQTELDRNVAAQVTRAAGSNFACAMLFLPRSRREALQAVYAFTRRTDDLVDEPRFADRRAERLGQWRALTAAALDGQTPPPGPLLGPDEEAIIRRFAQVSLEFNIPRPPAFDLIAGCEMDLTRARYADFPELRGYCYRVASCVGLLCLPVFGAPEAVAYAENLGIAFQITNILRDVAADWKEGRLYLPRDEMDAFDVSEDDVAAGRMTESLRRLIARQAERAEEFYRGAESARPRVHPRRLLAPQLMRHVYHVILDRVRSPSYDPFGPRVRISTARKAYLAARTWVRGS